MYTTKIYLRADQKNTDGSQMIYLQITHNRVPNKIPLNIRCFAQDWDKLNLRIKKSDPEYLLKNKKLQKAKAKIEQINEQFALYDIPFSLHEFKRLFETETPKITYFRDFVNFIKELESKSIKAISFKGWQFELNKLEAFKKDVTLNDIDLKFLYKYQNFMIERKNEHNTRVKTFSFLKAMINRAIKHGYLKTNPFKDFPIPKMITNPTFSTGSELDKLERFYYKNLFPENLQIVLQAYLFGCNTGLDYNSISNLKFSDIVKRIFDNEEVYVIYIIRQKTGQHISPPLNETAKKIYFERLQHKQFDNETVFKMYSHQTTNKKLRKIFEMCNIDNVMTWHKVRSTLVTNLLIKGVDLKIAGAILGHTDIRTTQGYAKVVDEMKYNSLKILDKK